MDKKELYVAPAVEEVDSRLTGAVAQGASGLDAGEPDDNNSGLN